MNKYRILFFLTPLFLVLLPSCKTVPHTERSQFIMLSQESEIDLGKQTWVETLKKSEISENEVCKSALQRVGNNLVASVDEKNYDWEFVVLESDVPNAFCLPGGKVAVHTAMFEILDNDAELAAIVGHEIAHAIARHGAERISHEYLKQFGVLALEIALSQASIPTFGLERAFGIATDLAILLPYNRTQEYEADKIGLIFMAKAGYNPKAALTFWKKFSEDSDDNLILEFFATHPMDQKRLKEIKDYLPTATEYYDEAPVKRDLGEKYSQEQQAANN